MKTLLPPQSVNILYLYILTVSIYSSVCVNENPTTPRTLNQCWSWRTVLVPESSSSSEMSSPCSSVRRSCSQMLVFVSHTTVWCLDYTIVFLRTRLSWTRTVFSTFGWDNLFLHLLCIHPSILHIMIYSDTETLVITEHNFLGNHVRLSKRTFPLSSMTCSMNVFTQLFWDLFICSWNQDQLFYHLHLWLIERLHDFWKCPSTSSCSMCQNVLSMMKKTLCTGVWNTFHRVMKKGRHLPTRGFRETVNRLTVDLVQTQTQIVQDIRGSTFHSVDDTQIFQHRINDSWCRCLSR